MSYVEKHGTELAARYPTDVLRFALVEALRLRAAAIRDEAARRRILRRVLTVAELVASVERDVDEVVE